jgi:hypothetical protein
MYKQHTVVIIPGLGDQINPIKWATYHWEQYGLHIVIHSIGWRNNQLSFELKFQKLLKLVDRLHTENHKISLVGTSAGGSAVLNVFMQRKDIVHKVINVCGRLRVGPTTGFRSFASKTQSSPSFAESVHMCEEHEKYLSASDRKRILTVRSLFGDELVPSETTIIQGAHNTAIPTIEHGISITAALTLFSKPLIHFLKDEE